MPITIPSNKHIRPTERNYKFIQAEAKVALPNPGPVCVSATGASGAGNALVEPAAGSSNRDGYCGFNVMHSVPAGQAPSIVRGAIVDGFAGVLPGVQVYLDATNGTLTQTATSNGAAIGLGWTSKKIYFY